MSGEKWTKQQLDKLKSIYASKEPWITNNELAGRLSGQFKKSKEAIRWQLRELHRESWVKPAKILLLDIEILPINANIWRVWKQDVSPVQVLKDWSVVCWSAKWLFEKTVYGEVVSPQDAIDRKDSGIMGGIWSMMNDADMVITHNGDSFDLKKLNTRFLVAGMPPPMYYKSIDTLSILKANFAFTYNKLDYVNQLLGIDRKMETSFKWWNECSAGNRHYLDMMLKYNMQDVHVLEELYVKLRPWMKGHPNMNVHSVSGAHVCPACSSANLQWNGTYQTGLGLYKAFRCEDCGAIGRSTQKKFKLAASAVQN